MADQTEVKKSSVVVESVKGVTKDQFRMPTWGALIALIMALLILKTFIYIKDPKREGK